MSEVHAPLDPVTIPEPTGVLAEPWSLSKVVRMAAMFGPAAIVASVAIGAGETIVVVQAGSWAGYSLLWLVLLSVLTKGVCVTYLLGRYTAVSGEPIGQRLVRMPGPRGWLLLAIIVLELGATGPLWAAIARPSGDLLFHLLERAATLAGFAVWHTPDETHELILWGLAAVTWKALFATAFILAALLLSLGISFKWLERQQVIICGILVLGTVAGTIMVRPDLWAALVGTLSFGLFPKEIPSWAPASAQLHRADDDYHVWLRRRVGDDLCGLRRLDQPARLGPVRPRPDRRDSPPRGRRQPARLFARRSPAGGPAATARVALALGRGPRGGRADDRGRLVHDGRRGRVVSPLSERSDRFNLRRLELVDRPGLHLRNIHPALVWVYYICVLAALWGTLQAYPDIYTRVTHDFCAAIWPKFHVPLPRLQLGMCLYVLASAVPLLWIDVNFATLTAIVAFLATNAGVALAMVAALYLDFQLPPLYRTRRWLLVAGFLSAGILIAVSVISGWALFGRLAGL